LLTREILPCPNLPGPSQDAIEALGPHSVRALDDGFGDGRGASDSGSLLPGLFDVNHPRNPEAVRNHAEAEGPESLLERHGNGATLF